MSGDKPLVYWDACVFLSWIKNEKRKSGEMAGVLACIDEFNSGKSILMTSAITFTEVLESKTGAENRQKFIDLFKRQNIKAANVDIKTAKLASELRDYYVNLGEEKILTTPDALHLATAIFYDADEFHTFDDGKSSKKSLGLLDLNGNVGGYRLIVVKPGARRQELLDYDGLNAGSENLPASPSSSVPESQPERSAGDSPATTSTLENAPASPFQEDPKPLPPGSSVH